MKKRRMIGFLILAGLIGIVIFISVAELEYAYVPDDRKIANNEQKTGNENKYRTSQVQNEESDELIQNGKRFFYEETFGNEVFFTDVMGVFNGAFTIPNIGKAIIQLKGQGTDNLKVEAAETVTIGDRTIKKGETFETGLDVPRGAFMPLGIKLKYEDRRIKAGISCAACHATVNQHGDVLQGVPNADLNIGLSVALATNTAAYFTHTEIENIKEFIKDKDRVVKNSEGTFEGLPDITALEEFVDQEIIKWPKGSNDTTIDFKNNPVQIPDTFTIGDHPYGWSGQGQIGPLLGLSAAINNAHSQNMDAVSQTAISKPVLQIDKEVYLGTLLQNAANKKYRYDPNSGMKPTEFFSKIDPTPGADGVNELIPSSTYPKINFMTSIGLLSSSPGYRTWEQINSMSAYMNSLHPPQTSLKVVEETKAEGRRVFQEAGCISCHGGNYLTSNKLISVNELQTDQSRALGFKGSEKYFAAPSMYDPETPVPLPKKPRINKLPLSKQQENQLKLAWAHDKTDGAYKTISLYGLYWSAPYLHDGGVAVGPNINKDLGVSGTFNKGIIPDPRNSLLALIDSKLRSKVVKENLTNGDLGSVHLSGKGHEFWVDETTGFTKKEQQVLIDYLLTVTD